MKRKVFALWFLCYIILLWPMVKKSYNDSHFWLFRQSIIVQIDATIVAALTYANIYGIVPIYKESRRVYKDISLYLNQRNYWQTRYRKDDTKYSDWQILLKKDVLPVVSAIAILVNLILAAMRCKDAGVCWWRCLIPLYNPFILLIKKSND